jgi:signal transduction histidine kinase/ligand-binding sensor domain-containing protein
VQQTPIRLHRLVLIVAGLLVFLLPFVACAERVEPGSTAPPLTPATTLDSGSGGDAARRENPQIPGSSPSQPDFAANLKFQHISRADGLSQNTILCIIQDHLGFIWICTEDGLNRYDGYDFTVFRHDPDDPDSLGQEAIWSVHEDHEGKLWLWKNRGGLERYDRQTGRFVPYDLIDTADPQSASTDFVWALIEEPSGTLWAGTYLSGLYRYDRDADQFVAYRHDPQDPASLSDNRVYAIRRGPEGFLWVSTRGGLNRLDEETGRFTHYRHEEGDERTLGSDIVQLIHIDGQGRFWVTTYGVGLEQFDPQTGQVITRYQYDPDDAATIDDTNAIREIFEDRLGLLWLIHFDGRLDRLDPETGTFVRYRHDPEDPTSLSHNEVSFVAEDRTGQLWIGTAGGLDRFDRQTGSFVHSRHDPTDPQSLSGNAVLRFFEDQAGVIWVGTSGQGLNLYDPAGSKFAHYRIESPVADPERNNVVNALFAEGLEAIWIGTDAGLNLFDRRASELVFYEHDPLDPTSLAPGSVLSIVPDGEGGLWIGTQSGLDRLDRSTGRFIHYLESGPGEVDLAIGAVMSIVPGDSGELWLGRYRYGLCRFEPDSGECTRYAYDPENPLNTEDMVMTAIRDRGGSVWLGTQGGLLRFDPATETFTRYTPEPNNPASLSHIAVRALAEDRNGMLWVGTGGGGLNKLDRATGTFMRYMEQQGLSSNTVLGILEDAHGALWLSTLNGLSKFDPADESVKVYDTGDGLQDSEFLLGAYAQNAGGEMLFGGLNGFNIFHPDEIVDNPYVPPVVLTSLTQGGVGPELDSTLESLSGVTFSWPNNFFEFEFAALSYSEAAKNQYAYRLDGFRDESWNYVGTKRFGRYTNLPGGTYTLRLKGSNSDGVWNEQGASLQITVVPPFWETWWFRGAVLGVLALLGFFLFWLRTRSIRSRSRELEQQVASRTKELAALNAISVVVSRSLDPQKILADAVDKTLEVTGLEAGGIYLLDEESRSQEGGLLKIATQKGLSPELVAGADNLLVGEGFSGRVVQTGTPLVVADLASDPRLTRQAVKEGGFRTVAIAPIVSRSAVFGTLFVMTRNEVRFTQQDVELLSSIGVQIGVAIENARLFSAEQRRSEQFRLINQVGRELALILDVTEVLQQVTRMVQAAFGYYHVGIGLIEGDEVVYRVGAGELWEDPEFEFKPAHLKVGRQGLSGWVAATGEPLLVPDVTQESRYVWMRRSRTRSELIVPIAVKGEVIGVLDAQSDRLNAFDETDLSVLQSLAHQVGAAIENARLYEQAQESAVLAERGRLARDLHDAVTQTLFSASLIAEAVPDSWKRDQREGEELLTELRQLTRGALAEMRTLLLELRPAALVETSLSDLLHQLAEAAMGRVGIPVTVTTDRSLALPPDGHVAIYRIAQEAMNNVVKHAYASRAEVSLQPGSPPPGRGRSVELVVWDDGQGFDPGEVTADHLGLGIMQERAEAIGARLHIESQVGQGTRIFVHWQEDAPGEVT